eukprot:scaffold3281_cov286-Prasinococcus_capsulatus_cf.AAC.13
MRAGVLWQALLVLAHASMSLVHGPFKSDAAQDVHIRPQPPAAPVCSSLLYGGLLPGRSALVFPDPDVTIEWREVRSVILAARCSLPAPYNLGDCPYSLTT